MENVRARIAVKLAVWRIADSAAKAGDIVDIDQTADELLARHPAAGLSRAEVTACEDAAVRTPAAIYSDRRG